MKLVAAITGLFLVLFVLAHMLGNLQVFLGPEALNAYAGHIQGLGGGLWVVRLILLAIFAVHIYAVVTLQLRNWSARPVGYAKQEPLESTFSSRTMIWTGLLVLAFIVYHLLHYTVKSTHLAHHAFDAAGHPDVYTMVTLAFSQASVAITYIVAMILLGFHLRHGIPSLFQTLGWNATRYRRFTAGLGLTVALLIVAGNILMPLLILLGVVGH